MNLIKKVLTMTLLIVLSVAIFSQQTFAITTTDDFFTEISQEYIEDNIDDIDDLIPTLNSTMVKENETVSARYLTDETISDYKYTETNAIISEVKINGNNLQIDLQAGEGLGKVELTIFFGESKYKIDKLFTYTTNGNTFISTESEDDAWYLSARYRHDTGQEEIETLENEYLLFSKRDIEEEVIIQPPVEVDSYSENSLVTESNMEIMSSKATYVTGRLMFRAKSTTGGTILKPLKFLKVELHDREPIGSTILGITYTDAEGYYSFTFDNEDEWWQFENGGCDVFIKAFAESYTFKIARDWIVPFWTYYAYESATIDNVATGSTTTFNFTSALAPDNMANNAFYVSQGLVVAQRFATNVAGMSTSKTLNVVYPFALIGDSAFAYEQYSGIGQNTFDKWDTLLHEYGHFVQGVYGAYGNSLWDLLIVYGPTHVLNLDLIHEKGDKEFGIQLAWSEAWATAFSLIAQDYYKTEYSGILYAGDTEYNNHGIVYEDYSPTQYSGEGQENAIIGLLWDLFDTYNGSEPDDNIHFGGYYNWFHRTLRSGIYSLSDFVKMMDEEHPEFRDVMGERLGYFQIAPSNVTITNTPTQTTPPTISWKLNGSTYNPNNRFQIVFYDLARTQKYVTSNINVSQAYNSTYTYTLSTSVWNSVLSNFTGTTTIYVAVKGYLTSSPITGPFISRQVPITINLPIKSLSIPASNRYTEQMVAINAGEYKEYYVTFASSTGKVIQTFGMKDTYLEIYNQSGTLIASDDNKGYANNAFISINLTAGIQYRIRVKFKDSWQMGEVKLAITQTFSYADYESAYGFTGGTANMTGTTILNHVFHFRFIPNVSKTYTIYTDKNGSSYTDLYLYLIDPRSTKPISSNFSQPSVYNDDGGGNLQAKIVKHLEAGVPYMIILSTYNIATQSGDFKLLAS